MIDGLKLTMTGDELRELLAQRASEHRARAGRWQADIARTPADQTEEAPLLPEHMCEYEADREEWLAEVLEFMREHLEPHEVYRLGQADLAFGELLPPKPGMVEQQEYEERTRVGFELGRIARQMRFSPEICRMTREECEQDR